MTFSRLVNVHSRGSSLAVHQHQPAACCVTRPVWPVVGYMGEPRRRRSGCATCVVFQARQANWVILGDNPKLGCGRHEMNHFKSYLLLGICQPLALASWLCHKRHREISELRFYPQPPSSV